MIEKPRPLSSRPILISSPSQGSNTPLGHSQSRGAPLRSLPRAISPHVGRDEGVLLLGQVGTAAEPWEDEEEQGDAQEDEAENDREVRDHDGSPSRPCAGRCGCNYESRRGVIVAGLKKKKSRRSTKVELLLWTAESLTGGN